MMIFLFIMHLFCMNFEMRLNLLKMTDCLIDFFGKL
jgi:hypothetical protein